MSLPVPLVYPGVPVAAASVCVGVISEIIICHYIDQCRYINQVHSPEPLPPEPLHSNITCIRCLNIWRVIAAGACFAIIFASLTVRFGVSWVAVPPTVAAVFLIILAAVDLKVYRLPDVIVAAATTASFLAVLVSALALKSAQAVHTSFIVALAYGSIFWIMYAINSRGIGFGDVKLAPMLGSQIGWIAAVAHEGHDGLTSSVTLVLQSLLFSSAIGLIMGIVVIGLRRTGYNVLPDPKLNMLLPDPKLNVSVSGSSELGSSVSTDSSELGDTESDGSSESTDSSDYGNSSKLGNSKLGDARKKQLASTAFPFGPALAAGTLITVIFS